jgi:transcription termination factor NusB
LDEVDREYITLIRDHYTEFESEVESLVNPLLKQFQRKDLEAIKKAIFILGYTEWKVLGTDDKVIINEMIELAKRFGGSDVYKLVNGVFHELLVGGEKRE